MLDRTVADGLGVDLEALARVLEAALDGCRVTELSTGDEEHDVVLRLPPTRREELAAVPFTSDSGHRLAVGDVARFVPVAGAREVFRRDQRRIAQVTARIAPGWDYPQALTAARTVLAGLELGPGLSARLSGEEEERERTFIELRWAGALAVLLVLMVLAGSFESLVHPFTVLSSVPLAVVGVAAVLVPVGRPVGVMAVLGLIVLAGIAVNDAILLVATARDLVRRGEVLDRALARAASIRLRPILMTTATTALALLPLAVGSGEAAQLRAPMAITVMSRARPACRLRARLMKYLGRPRSRPGKHPRGIRGTARSPLPVPRRTPLALKALKGSFVSLDNL